MTAVSPGICSYLFGTSIKVGKSVLDFTCIVLKWKQGLIWCSRLTYVLDFSDLKKTNLHIIILPEARSFTMPPLQPPPPPKKNEKTKNKKKMRRHCCRIPKVVYLQILSLTHSLRMVGLYFQKQCLFNCNTPIIILNIRWCENIGIACVSFVRFKERKWCAFNFPVMLGQWVNDISLNNAPYSFFLIREVGLILRQLLHSEWL